VTKNWHTSGLLLLALFTTSIIAVEFYGLSHAGLWNLQNRYERLCKEEHY